jgi:hypothetical protein
MRSTTLAALLSVLMTGCELGLPAPDATATAHADPSAGFVHVVAEPPVARTGFRVELRDGDAHLLELWTFRMGELVIAEAATMPAEGLRLWSATAACDGEFSSRGGIETDVVFLTDPDGRCASRVEGEHPYEDSDHAFGAIAGRITGGGDASNLRIVIRSLDSPPNPVPGPVMPDESSHFFVSPVAQGAYEVRLHRGPDLVRSDRVIVGAGAEGSVQLDLSLD